MKLWHKITLGAAFAGTITTGGTLATDAAINPYIDTGTTLEIQNVSSLPEGGTIKNVVSKDEPRITLEKWNGEIALGIKSLDIPSDTNGSRPFLSKNVEWQSGDIKMEAVPLDPSPAVGEDGGMEINIILNSLPSSNVFTFQLDNWENLDFFYQAPLTDEEMKEGSSRPDNVVGSYAVYYKDHANHIEGQTNYATGKAYHIYRPLVTDANGTSIWADLSYSNGLLTVTVPQDFLNNAAYPVKVDPTFGYTTQGGTTTGLNFNNMACSFINKTVASSGSVDSMQYYVTSFGAAAKGVVIDGAALTILTNGVTASGGVPVSTDWKIITYSSKPSIVGGNDYAICIVEDSGGATLRTDAGSSGDSKTDSTNSFATPTDPTDAINSSLKYSIYATYTATTVSSPTIVPRASIRGPIIIGGQTIIQ